MKRSNFFLLVLLTTLQLRAAVATGLALSNAPGAGSNNLPTLQFHSSVFEADLRYWEGINLISLPVIRDGPDDAEVSFTATTRDGSARSGEDYVAQTNTLTLAPGVRFQRFDMLLIDDLTAEPPESFAVVLSDPVGARLGTNSVATVTIADNEPGLRFTTTRFATSEGAGLIALSVVWYNELGYTQIPQISVNYATRDGTAQAGADYTAQTGVVTLTPGVWTNIITIALLDDNVPEPSEYFEVVLGDPVGGRLGTNSVATVTIEDNEPVLRFFLLPFTANEDAGFVRLAVLRDGSTASAVAVTYTTGDGTAQAGTDYAAQTGSVTLAAGERTNSFTIPLLDDTNPELREHFQVTLSDPVGARLGTNSVATVTIEDNEPVLRFETSRASVGEGADLISLSVVWDGGAASTVTVTYSTRDGTARAGADYVAQTATLTFAPGEKTKKIIVPLLNDIVGEQPENFEVILSNPTGGAVLGADGIATVTIEDDEPVLRFNDPYIPVNESSGFARFLIVREGSTASAVAVTYSTTDGSAQAGTDYVPQTNIVTLAPGETTKAFTVPLLDDTTPELTENFRVTLSNPTGGARLKGNSVATVDIYDNDPANDIFEFEFSAYTVSELDGAAVISVGRSPPARGSARVNFATSAATATAGVDFQPVGGTLHFIEGQTNATFSVPILEDSLTENDEALILTLANPVSSDGNQVGLGTRSVALLTIKNSGPGIQFDGDVFYVNENDGFAHILARRRGDTNSAFSVDFTTNANGSKDYLPQSGTLTFAAGQLTNGFTVPILDNGLVDGGRSFLVTLTNGTGGVVLLPLHTAQVVIADNEVSAALDTSFSPEINGPVGAAALQPDGKPIIAGSFDRVNGIERFSLARLNVDGSLDTSFNAAVGVEDGGCCPDIRALQLQPDGKLLIGGNFFNVGGVSRNGPARLHPDGTLDPTFVPASEITGYVSALALQDDGKVLAIVGSALFRLNADGSRDLSFNIGQGANGGVWFLAVQGDGKILIGGVFDTFNGVNRHRIARLHADGSIDPGFSPVAVDPVTGNSLYELLAVQSDGKLIVSGSPLARLNSDGSWDPTFRAESYWSVAAVQAEGKVLVASGNRMMRLEPDGLVDFSFLPVFFPASCIDCGSSVSFILPRPDGQVFIGGNFSAVNGFPARYLALLRGNTATASSFQFERAIAFAGENEGTTSVPVRRAGVTSRAESVTYTANNDVTGTLAFAPLETVKLIPLPLIDNINVGTNQPLRLVLSNPAGGALLGRSVTTLTIVDDERPGSIDFRFNAGLALPPQEGIVSVDRIHLLPSGKLQGWGNFATSHGIQRSGFAQLNADGSLDASVSQAQPPPFSAQPDGKYFGYASNRFVRLNPDGSVDPTFNVIHDQGSQSIYFPPLLQPDGKVIVRGNFTVLNGITSDGLARLNADGSTDASFDSGGGFRALDGSRRSINAVALQADGRILISGDFQTVRTVRRAVLARLNADGSLDTSFDPSSGKPESFSGWVQQILVQADGRIIVLGALPAFNPSWNAGIFRLHANGTLDAVLDWGSGPRIDYPGGNSEEGGISIMTFDAENRLLLGGTFTSFNGAPRAGIVRLNLGDTPARPVITRVSRSAGGAFAMTIRGQSGRNYRIETSSDLVTWTLAREMPSAEQDTEFQDTEPAGPAIKFYRVQAR